MSAHTNHPDTSKVETTSRPLWPRFHISYMSSADLTSPPLCTRREWRLRHLSSLIRSFIAVILSFTRSAMMPCHAMPCHLAMLPAFASRVPHFSAVPPAQARDHRCHLECAARLHVPAAARRHLHAASESKAPVVPCITCGRIPAPTKSKHNIHVVCCCITSKPTAKAETPS